MYFYTYRDIKYDIIFRIYFKEAGKNKIDALDQGFNFILMEVHESE